MKKISILGSTGSIGTQALEVVDICKDVCVEGLSANNNVKLLAEQIRKYKPKKTKKFIFWIFGLYSLSSARRQSGAKRQTQKFTQKFYTSV